MRTAALCLVVLLATCSAEAKKDKKDKDAPKAEKKQPKAEPKEEAAPVLKMGDVSVGADTLAAGKKLAGAAYTERSTFKVSTTLKSNGAAATEVAMAAVRFQHTVSGAEVWYPLAVDGDGYSAEVHLPRDAELKFFFEAGVYRVAVLAADPRYDAPLERELGEVKLNLVAPPLFKQKQEYAELDRWARRRPQAWDIAPPAKKADGLSAVVFSGLLGLPVLVLLTMLLNASVHPGTFFSAVMAHPATAFRNMAFLGTLCAMCAVLFFYWINVGLTTTVINLSLLTIPAIAFHPRHADEAAEGKAKTE